MVTAYSGSALRRSTWHFITGKIVSAIFTFILLLWLVRALPVDEYAAYVTFVAAVEVSFALSFVGLPWLAARYLPEFRIHAPIAALKKLSWRLVGWHFAIVCIFTLMLLALLEVYLIQFRLEAYRSAAMIYLLVFIVEAVGRFAKENVLCALFQQGIAQASVVLRSFSFLVLLVLASFTQKIDLDLVAWSELLASLASTFLAIFGLWRYLSSLESQKKTKGWVEPSFWHMWPAALKMYGAQLMTLVYSPQVVLNIVQFWLGAQAAATFGFLKQLYELVGRYLPATLLFSLVRPKLVASYVHAGSISDLSRNANLAGKVSYLVLMPAIAFAAVGGEILVSMLSGGKFTETGLLFFGLLLALVPLSQRQLLETVTVATGYAGICTLAAATGLAVPLLMALLLELGLGLWAGIVGIVLGHSLFDTIVLYGVTRKVGFSVDIKGYGNLLVAGFAGYLVAAALPYRADDILMLAVMGIGTLIGYLSTLLWLRPIDEDERRRIYKLIRTDKLDR